MRANWDRKDRAQVCSPTSFVLPSSPAAEWQNSHRFRFDSFCFPPTWYVVELPKLLRKRQVSRFIIILLVEHSLLLDWGSGLLNNNNKKTS